MTRLFWILLATLLASSAAAQSLAEIAKKEKERRANNDAEQTQMITERELRTNLRGPMTTSTAVAATDEESDSEDDDAGAEPEQVDPSQTREYWRNRLSGVDGRIQTLQQQLQSPLYTSDPRGASRRQRLEQQLAQAQAERDDIVEEARRAGAPPGWLR